VPVPIMQEEEVHVPKVIRHHRHHQVHVEQEVEVHMPQIQHQANAGGATRQQICIANLYRQAAAAAAAARIDVEQRKERGKRKLQMKGSSGSGGASATAAASQDPTKPLDKGTADLGEAKSCKSRKEEAAAESSKQAKDGAVSVKVAVGDGVTKSFELRKGEGKELVRVGRSSKNDVVLSHAGISANHYELKPVHNSAGGQARLAVKDISTKGVGLRTAPGRPLERLEKGVDVVVPEASFYLLVPFKVRPTEERLSIHVDIRGDNSAAPTAGLN